jgi:tripartite ATP-independent transporter DctM subunit
MSAITFAAFFMLSLLGIPIAHALIVGSTLAMAASDRGSLSLIVEQMVSQVGSFPLLAIPFFMLTGSIMMGGTLGKNLLDFLSTLMARFHGGPGQVGVLSSTFFGGISGSAVADASAIGSLLIPWQKKLGYPAGFAAATIASSATIDILIPPSIPFIIYALVSQTSIADLFVAGILPGMLLCFGFMAVCYVSGRLRGFQRERRPINPTVLLKEFGYSFPGLLLPVLIVLTLRFGIATPTEVSVMAAAYALLVSLFLYRDLTWSRLLDCIVEAGVSTGVVLLVIMASSVVGWIVTFEQIPQAVTGWMTQYLSEPWLIILAMNLILLFLGMFLDLPAAVLLVTPIFLPLASSIGMDGVQLGVMIVVNLAMGLYTPPVGTTLFIASSVAKVPMGAVVKEMAPFYGVALLVLFLVSYVPAFIIRG